MVQGIAAKRRHVEFQAPGYIEPALQRYSGVMRKGVTRNLAENVASLRYGDIPATVIQLSKSLILDALGCMVAGALQESGRKALRYVESQAATPIATVALHGVKTHPYYAALANGAFCHGWLFDDTMGRGLSCESVLVPAALALAEQEYSSGHDVITAVVAGWEVICRIAASATPVPSRRPLDPIATFGPWGATAVAGQLLGFRGDDMENALSLSSGQAAASLQATQTGGAVARLHPGFAAMYGLRAARLAQLGLSGAREILEGPMGFLMCVAGLKADETPNFDVDRINAGFGDEWYIEGVTLKQHPVTHVQLSIIAAVERLRGEMQIASTEVAEVEVAFPRSSDTWMRSPIRVPRPGDVLGAQQSIAWGVAVALVLGRNDLPAYQHHVPPHGRSGEIAALAERVRVVDHDAANGTHPDFPTVTVRLKTGGSVEAECTWPRGSYLHNPMTAAELRDKFKRQAGLAGLSEAQQASVLETVAALEAQDDMTRLMTSVIRGG